VDGRIVDKNSSLQSCEVETLFLFRIQSFLWEHPVANVFPVSLGYQCFKDDPNRIRKPSATVIRLDRMDQFANSDPDYMLIPPDLAIEVIAPNDTIFKIDQRVAEYLSAGFPLVWVADPKALTITVHPLNGRPAIYEL
jgi:Uma2 family endonuclease